MLRLFFWFFVTGFSAWWLILRLAFRTFHPLRQAMNQFSVSITLPLARSRVVLALVGQMTELARKSILAANFGVHE
jgi:hypothetical protein